MPWYNITFKDDHKIRLEAASKVEAVSRATILSFRAKREWIVKSANPMQNEPVQTIALDEQPELEFSAP